MTNIYKSTICLILSQAQELDNNINIYNSGLSTKKAVRISSVEQQVQVFAWTGTNKGDGFLVFPLSTWGLYCIIVRKILRVRAWCPWVRANLG